MNLNILNTNNDIQTKRTNRKVNIVFQPTKMGKRRGREESFHSTLLLFVEARKPQSGVSPFLSPGTQGRDVFSRGELITHHLHNCIYWLSSPLELINCGIHGAGE